MNTTYYVVLSIAFVISVTLTHGVPISRSNIETTEETSLLNTEQVELQNSDGKYAQQLNTSPQPTDEPNTLDQTDNAVESSIPSPDTQSDPTSTAPQPSTDFAIETTGKSATPIVETPLMQNGEKYDDLFYVRFRNRDNVDDIVALALDWDAVKQHDHFRQMQYHVNANDEHAEYAQRVIHAAQRLLDESLRQANCHENVSIEDYVQAAYTMQKYRKIDDPKMEKVLQALQDYQGDDLENVTDAGELIKDEYRMQHSSAPETTPLYNQTVPQSDTSADELKSPPNPSSFETEKFQIRSSDHRIPILDSSAAQPKPEISSSADAKIYTG